MHLFLFLFLILVREALGAQAPLETLVTPHLNYVLPSLSSFCPNCLQLPTVAYKNLSTLHNTYLPQPSASKCGDGICNTALGESCGNCKQDCGPCRFSVGLRSCFNKSHATLTFDDGPSPVTSNLLLKLKELKVNATFFVNTYRINDEVDATEINKPTGWTRSSLYAKDIKQAFDEGHVIASHTYSHIGLVNGTGGNSNAHSYPLESMRMQLLLNDLTIRDIIGKSPLIFRPPYLEFNTSVLNSLDSMGYIPVLINADSYDYAFQNLSPKESINAIVNATKAAIAKKPPSEGPLLLQHDLYQTTVDALPQIIQHLKDGKYEMVSLATCLGLKSSDMYRDDTLSPFNRQKTTSLLSILQKTTITASNSSDSSTLPETYRYSKFSRPSSAFTMATPHFFLLTTLPISLMFLIFI